MKILSPFISRNGSRLPRAGSLLLRLALAGTLTQQSFAPAMAGGSFWAERREARAQSTLGTGLPVEILAPIVSIPLFEKSSTNPLVSPRWGRVRNDANSPLDAKPFLLYIEDAHRNPDAQRNISAAIQELVRGRRVNALALEGAEGPLETARFRNYTDQGAVRRAADFLLNEGRLSGALHAAMTFLGDAVFPPVTGVDDPGLHARNVRAYLDASDAQGAWREKFLQRERDMASQIPRVFNPALVAFDERIQAYRDGRVPLGDFLGSPAVRGILRRQDKASALFLSAHGREQALDFRQVERERVSFVGRLAKRLPVPALQRLTRESLAARAGEMSQGDYCRSLADLCRRHGVQLLEFPALAAYMAYAQEADGIDVEPLFDEVNELERRGYAQLAHTSEERRLVRDLRRLRLAQSLVDYSLTPDQWADYRSDPDPDLAAFEDFYRVAEERDEAMVSRLIETIRGGGTAALVAGGFHGPGIRRRLAAAGVRVVTFTPRINKISGEDGSTALSLFAQERTPLDRLFQGRRLFLAPDPRLDLRETPALLAAEAVRRTAALEAAERWRRDPRQAGFLSAARGALKELGLESLVTVRPPRVDVLDDRTVEVTVPLVNRETEIAARARVRFHTDGSIQAVDWLDAEPLGWGRKISLWGIRLQAWALARFRQSPERAENGFFSRLSRWGPPLASWLLARHKNILLADVVERFFGLAMIPMVPSRDAASAHAVYNRFFPASLTFGRASTDPAPAFPGLTVQVNLLDVGSYRDGQALATRRGLAKARRLLPLLARRGVGGIYLTQGLYEQSPLGGLVHTVPDRGEHLLESGPAKILVWNYQTKRLTVNGVLLNDRFGNNFSVKDMAVLNPLVFDAGGNEGRWAELKEFVEAAHAIGLEVTVDLIPWLAPDGITAENYQWAESFMDLSPHDTRTDESLLRKYPEYGLVRVNRPEGGTRRVLVKHFLPGKDQIMPNFRHPGYQAYLRNHLRRLINAGVDRARVDMAHRLLLGGDPQMEPWTTLIRETHDYASTQGRRFRFLMESYRELDDWPARFLDQIGADESYDVNPFHSYEKIAQGEGSLLDLRSALDFAALNRPGRRVVFPSNFDEPSLKNLGGPALPFLAMLLTYQRAHGLPLLMELRDLLDEEGQNIPQAGGENWNDRVKNFYHPFLRSIRPGYRSLRRRFKRSPPVALLEELKVLFDKAEKIEILDTVDQGRYFAVAVQRGPRVDVRVFDFSSHRPRAEFWVAAPAALADMWNRLSSQGLPDLKAVLGVRAHFSMETKSASVPAPYFMARAGPLARFHRLEPPPRFDSQGQARYVFLPHDDVPPLRVALRRRRLAAIHATPAQARAALTRAGPGGFTWKRAEQGPVLTHSPPSLQGFLESARSVQSSQGDAGAQSLAFHANRGDFLVYLRNLVNTAAEDLPVLDPVRMELASLARDADFDPGDATRREALNLDALRAVDGAVSRLKSIAEPLAPPAPPVGAPGFMLAKPLRRWTDAWAAAHPRWSWFARGGYAAAALVLSPGLEWIFQAPLSLGLVFPQAWMGLALAIPTLPLLARLFARAHVDYSPEERRVVFWVGIALGAPLLVPLWPGLAAAAPGALVSNILLHAAYNAYALWKGNTLASLYSQRNDMGAVSGDRGAHTAEVARLLDRSIPAFEPLRVNEVDPRYLRFVLRAAPVKPVPGKNLPAASALLSVINLVGRGIPLSDMDMRKVPVLLAHAGKRELSELPGLLAAHRQAVAADPGRPPRLILVPLDESAEEALPKVAGLSEKKFVHVFPRARLATRKGAAHLDVLALHEEFEKWRVVETREGRLEGTGVAVLWSAPADLVDQESAFLLPEGSPLRDALQALLLILRETPLTPADLGAVLRFALLVARQA